jgi:hypothetical protein
MGKCAVQQSPNRLLFDFYLSLLSIREEPWRSQNQELYHATLYAIAKGIQTDPETVQNIFERMAREDHA